MKIFLFLVLIPFTFAFASQTISPIVQKNYEPINIAFGVKRPPYLFKQANKKGIEIELVLSALKSQGYQIGEVYQMQRNKQQNILEKNPRIDMAVTVPKTKKKGVYYSKFISFNNSAITRTKDDIKILGIKDLVNYKVASFGLAHKFLGENYFKLFNPKDAPKNYDEYEDQREHHEKFFSQEKEVLIGDRTTFNYFKRLFKFKYNTDLQYTSHKVLSGLSQRHIAFRDKQLRDDFDIGFKKLKDTGEYGKIVLSYLDVDVGSQLKFANILATIISKDLVKNDIKNMEKAIDPFFNMPFIEGIKVIDHATQITFFEKYKKEKKENHESILEVEKNAFLYVLGEPIKAGKVIVYFNENIKNKTIIYPSIKEFKEFSLSELNRIENIYNENLKDELVKVELTQKEKKWLQENPIINVHNQIDLEPLNYYEKSTPKGFSIDYMNLLASKIGVKVKYVTGKWDELLQSSYDKKLDVMLNIIKKKHREKNLLFVGTYLQDNTPIITKENNVDIVDMKSLSGKIISVIKGSIYEEILRQNYPEIKLILVKNFSQAVKKVIENRADATIGSTAVIGQIIKNYNIKGLKYIGSFEEIAPESGKFNIAVRNDAKELQSILQKAMRTIEFDTMNNLKAKWLPQAEDKKIFTQSLKDSRQASLLEVLSLHEILFTFVILILLAYLIYQYYSKSKFLNIDLNKFIFIIITFEFATIIYILYSLIVFDRTENRLEEISTNKFNLIQVSDELRQTSEDLTKNARSYVITKNLKYKKRYNDILEIRNGNKYRPMHYNSFYWDISEELRKAYHPPSEKISLKNEIESLPFTDRELSLLQRAEDNSNKLTKIEKRAFNKVINNNQQEAIDILYSQKYYKAKELIMNPIDEAIIYLNIRSDKTIEILENKIAKQFVYILIAGMFFILGNFLIYLMLNKKLNIPIRYLTNAILSFKRGEKNIEKQSFYKDEIGEMNEEFFFMKSVIEEGTKNLEGTIESLSIMQEKLVQSEKMASLGNLVAGVAHEINTPIGISLTGITHFRYITDNLKNEYDNDNLSEEEFNEYIKNSSEIAESVESSLVKAVEQIQSFKRVAVDQSEDEKKEIDLEDYIRGILLSLRNKLKNTKHNVSLHFEGDMILKCYPGAISQIITNFILNSLIHGFKNIKSGNINIYVKTLDNHVELIYQDDGKGIEESNIKKIFDPFFTTNREGGGSGLGLNIVFNIVKSQLKGEIEVNSIFGKGVEYKITFPMDKIGK